MKRVPFRLCCWGKAQHVLNGRRINYTMLPRLDRPARSCPTENTPRGLAIMGSTGSIGTQALEIVALFPERLSIKTLAAGSKWELLAEQARRFLPELVAIRDVEYVSHLEAALAGTGIRVVAGLEGLAEAATLDGIDTVVAAIVGLAGLPSTLAALELGREIALANKESLVVGGELVTQLVERFGSTVLPVDSEHSAIFQCLLGEQHATVEHLTLTASGGPFREWEASQLASITPQQALKHPNWDMGAKVTIDSATLMNKGLEVIEAYWLFGLPPEKINVLVHPQSIVHSFVAFQDGSVKAQLGVPDMRVPIQYALTFPDRWPAPHPRIDWAACSSLTFEAPDIVRFPCLDLAYTALREGGLAPAVLNAANEIAVERFLKEDIRFTDIPRIVEAALQEIDNAPVTLENIRFADEQARRIAQELHTTITI